MAGKPNARTPIFLGHGDSDPVVQYAWGVKTADHLKELGCAVEFNTYPKLGHSVHPRELNQLGQFLVRVLPPA